MAISLGVHAIASHATAATTSGITTTSGSALLYLCAGTTSLTNLTDSKGNTPVLVGSEITGGSGFKVRVYRAWNITGGAGHTATLTQADSTLHLIEIKGVDTSSPQDQVNNINRTASPYTSPSITTTVADEILIGYQVCDGGTGSVFTHGNSFTGIETETDGNVWWPSASSYRIVSATGTYNTSVTIATSPSNTTNFIISLKIAGGGGGPSIAVIAGATYRRRRIS